MGYSGYPGGLRYLGCCVYSGGRCYLGYCSYFDRWRYFVYWAIGVVGVIWVTTVIRFVGLSLGYCWFLIFLRYLADTA
jgi:hypothetical protein